MEDRVIFAGRHLRAVCANPDARDLFVSFDNWRKERAGFPEAAPVRSALMQGFASLRIVSAQNDWFLNDDMEPLQQALAGFVAGFARVHGIGFSMGAYGCLAFSGALRMQRALLFSPQLSIFRQIAPFETRFAAEAARIDAARDQMAVWVKRDLQGIVAFDPRGFVLDGRHARQICGLLPGMVGVALPFAGHPAVGLLADVGRYGDVLRPAIGGTLTASGLRALHRLVREETPRYLRPVTRYVTQTRPKRMAGGVLSGEQDVIQPE